MLGTRKELDEHVHKMLAKLPPGRERDVKGWAIGRMYFKINEYAKAIEYLSAYLKVNEEAAACKLIANCYKLIKTPDFRRALEYYQRSIQLNPKQPDVIIDACQLIVKHSSLYNHECASYWLDIAESTQDLYDNEVVFDLRNMQSGVTALGTKEGVENNIPDNLMEQIIQRELLARPKDTKMRVRLMINFLEKKRFDEAFHYAYKVEFELPGQCDSSDWYDVVWTMLNKQEQSKEISKDWSFWQLAFVSLDRLIQISLQSDSSTSLAESIGQLFKLDQYIEKFSHQADNLAISGSRELHQCCQDHYTGQLLLHAATLLFKRELIGNKNKWSNTVRAALPLLLLGYQKKFVKEEKASHWQRHCNSDQHKLLQLWRHQAAFRSAQLGRTLYGCVQSQSNVANDKDLSWQANKSQRLWSSSDELLSAARQHCVDPQWRKQLYHQLFTHTEHKLKEQTSHLVRDQRLQQPLYEWPSLAEIEAEEQEALLLAPPTLEHHVYLALGTDNLAEAPRIRFLTDMRRDCYQGLSYCGSDSISQLDVEVFLYAVVLQVKRKLEVLRENYNSYHVGNANAAASPYMLPFANIMGRNDLITSEQLDWWSMIRQLQKSAYLTENGNCIEQREHLQHGLEAVRGVKGPHAEIIVVLQLAKLLSSREDKFNLDLRIEMLYKLGIKMMRSHNQQLLEPFYRFFKYANPLETSVWLKTKELTDEAARYLSNRLFKQTKYEEFLEVVRGLETPMIIYLRAEAYRHLVESSRTSRVSRLNFQDRRLECLRQTKSLLANDQGHPLVSLVQRELKSCQADESYATSDQQQHHNNSSTYEDAEDDFYAAAANSLNRSRRQAPESTPAASPALKDVEDTVKEMSKQLCGLKDGMDSMREEIKSFNDKFTVIEELLKKFKISGGSASRETPTADVETALGLEEFLNMEEALQPNYLNGVQANAPERFFSPSGNIPHPNAAFGNPMFNQNQMYNYYASQAQFMRTPPAPGSMPPNFFGPRGPPNYGLPPNMFPNPTAAAPYIDGLNYGMPAQPPASLVMPQVTQAQTPVMPPLAQAPVQSNLSIPPSGNFFGNTFTPSPIQVPQVAPQQAPASAIPPTVQALKAPISTQSSTPSIVSASTSQVVFGSLSSTPLQSAAPLAGTLQAAVPSTTGPAAPLTAAVPFAATTTSTAPPVPVQQSGVFNRALNNQPVEKEPPANVVITSSDPLPKPAVSSAQPTLSVTIPPQHIKPSLVQSTTEPAATPSLDFFANNKTGGSSTMFSGFSSTFSFKTQVAQAAAEKEKEREAEAEAAHNESVSSELNQSTSHDTTAELDYDPRPDFQGIIPLPDEVEVHTGEEDEEVKFTARAKLFRHVENEWKERGIGSIKILKNKSNGTARILMRREQTHKICANHKITAGMTLTVPLQDKEAKSFLWVANDFADEKLQLEKFLVRFKLPSTAAEFKAAFEKETPSGTAEAVPVPVKEKVPTFGAVKSSTIDSFVTSTPSPATAQPKQIEQVKSGVGKEAKPVEPAVPKSLFGNTTGKSNEATTSSPFANFTFGSATSTAKSSGASFSFGSISALPDSSSNNSAAFTTAFNFGSNLTTNKEDSTLQTESKSSNSFTFEVDREQPEYEPTAVFEPVIPLPELVNVVTGEENELVLFEHRAKLLRFDKEANEWKERGLGNMKVLQLKTDPSQVRLLMRREQVLKLCCNQRLQPDTKFSYIKNSQNSLTWAAQDYSEEALVPELLCVRFKTAETCKAFYDAILKAQANMTGVKSEDKEEQATKVDNDKSNNKDDKAKPQGFGDKFKPKAGSWSCQSCYTNNDEKQSYCQACEAPKDDTVPPKPQKLEPSGALNLSSSAGKFSFGFAPSATSSTSVGFSFDNKAVADTATKTPSVTAPVVVPAAAPAAASAAAKPIGFGDAFKPKEGNWSCKACYINNDATQLHCLACQEPKDETVPKKENKLDTSGGISFPATASKFTFGFGAATTTPAAAPAPASTAAAPTATPFGSLAPSTTSDSSDKNKGGVFGSSSFNFKPQTTSVTPSNSGFGAISLTSNTFSFSMPKVQTQQPKSPAPVTVTGDTSNNDESYAEEEESNAYFAPIIPLPDKIDVKTGEEEEDLLYVHRAKLYRMSEDGEWKERGLGDVKILRHKETKHLRVVMRREKVLKICLNHVLNSDVIYKPKDEKSWLFVVHDFSEGESVLERFALRFKNVEIAKAFHKAVSDALDGTAEPIQENEQASETTSNEKKDDSDANNELKQLANKLSLSVEFLTSTTKCDGCRGCEPDTFVYGEPAKLETSIKPLPMTLPALKISEETTQSSATEVIPAGANRVLLKASSLAANNNSANTFGSFSVFGNAISANSTTTNTETTEAPQASGDGAGAARTGGFLFGKSENSVFGQSLFGNNSAAIKPPQKSIFGGGLATDLKFGTGEGSIFGGSMKQTTLSGAQDETPKMNIFSNSVLSGNSFANTTGSNTPSGNLFGSAVIGGEAKDKNITFADLNKTGEAPTKDNKENIVAVPGDGTKSSNDTGSKFFDFSAKAGDDFASLATKGTNNAIGFPKSETGGFFGLTHQDDFKNFKSAPTSSKSEDAADTSTTESETIDANYDPHYDPIIALPKEIVVSTGEENETKLFGERATLYRFDSDTKEWKERGVGELKVLKHNTLNTYRMVMRREQILKLVLNMNIGKDFSMDYMNEQKKSFIWANLNFAENEEGEVERLACRFKNIDLANRFFETINQCKKDAKEDLSEDPLKQDSDGYA